MLLRILAGLALAEVTALALLATAHRVEPVRTLPLVKAQMSICRPLGPPPGSDPDSSPQDGKGSFTPPPDYSPRDTGHIA